MPGSCPTAACPWATACGVRSAHPHVPTCRLAEKPGTQVNMTIQELEAVITDAQMVCAKQPALLEVDAPVQIVGDIHGQYHDLMRLFEHVGYPPDTNYLFLGCAHQPFASVNPSCQPLSTACVLTAGGLAGWCDRRDYVDRGKNGLECICLLLCCTRQLSSPY